jgi:hypothetical protein
VTDENPAAPSRRGLLAATYVAAAVIGVILGRQGLFSLGGGADARSTSLARVGFALQDPTPEQTQPADWAALRADVDYVRDRLNAQTNGVFDLVAAVRGLDHGGTPDFGRAEQLCRGLKWPNCERAALEQLRLSSRP